MEERETNNSPTLGNGSPHDAAYASDRGTFYYVPVADHGDPSPVIARVTVGDVMYERPKTLPHDATVADVRELFATSRLRLALLVYNDVCIGTLSRDDLPEDAEDGEGAATFAHVPLTVGRNASLTDAHRIVSATSEGRVVVVDDAGRLIGLLCRNTAGTGFCVRKAPDQHGSPEKRTRWHVVRTSGDERHGLLTAPEGVAFQPGDSLNLPSQDGVSGWIVVAVEPGTGDEGTLVVDPLTD
jgi:CBS domain-containing protein